MNTTTIQKKVINQAIYYGHHMVVKNFYFFDGWECDVLSVDRFDYTTEYEVKRSRPDFLADFNKKEKHYSTSNGYGCNYFYFACPNNLIKPYEIPEYAGLIYASAQGSRVIKRAPQLHKESLTYSQLRKIAVKIMNSKYV